MIKSAAALSTITLLLVGCDAVSERDCGVFDHPDLALWQADTAEAQVQFMSAEGQTIGFTQSAVSLNTPFLGTDGSSNDEDVTCELTAQISWQANDDSLSISASYLQQEQLLLDATDETLLIDFSVEAPVGTELAGNYLADISISTSRLNLNSTRVIYLENDQSTEEIGGQAYQDVVRINAVELTSTAESGAAIDAVRQVVIAREFGLVAFTDSQGQEFVRVATP